MNHPACGDPECGLPVTTPGVRLNLVTQYGRAVTVVFHEGCAMNVQGRMALQARRRQIELDGISDRARYEAQRYTWTPKLSRLLRKRLGMTQTEFATAIKASRMQVYRHELDDSKPWFGKSHVLIELEVLAARRTGKTIRDDIMEEADDGTSNERRDAPEAPRRRQGAVRASGHRA
jgi:DNA-binding XRE family transcriptional regulator